MPKYLSFLSGLLLFGFFSSCSKVTNKIPIPPIDSLLHANVSTTFGSNSTSWLITVHDVNNKLGSTDCSIATDPAGNVYALMTVYGIFDMDPGPGIAIGGNSSIIYSATLIKYSPTGKLLWSKQFNPDGSINRVKVIADNSGNVYCKLHLKQVNNLQFDGNSYTITGDNLILKFNGQGNKLWLKNILFNDGDGGSLNSICTDAKGNLYLAGITPGQAEFFDDGPYYSAMQKDGPCFVYAKYDPSGKLLMTKDLPVRIWDFPSVSLTDKGFMAVDKEGNVYFTGQAAVSDWHGPRVIGNYHPIENYLGGFITKFDKDGNWSWFKEIEFDQFTGLGTDAEGNIYATGPVYPDNLANGIWKIDANGNDLWNDTFTTNIRTSDIRLLFDNAGNVTWIGECIQNNPAFSFSNALYINKYTPGGSLIYHNIITGYDITSREDVLDAGLDNAGNIDLFGGYESSFKLLDNSGDPRDPPNDYSGGYLIAHFPDKQR